MDYEAGFMKRSLSFAGMLGPSLLAFGFLFVVPVGYFFLQSFWREEYFTLERNFTFYNYIRAYEDYGYSWLFTLAIGFTIGLLTTIFAFALAYFAHFRAGRFGPIILFLTLTTLFGGYLVKIYAWKSILGVDGVLNTTLIMLGIIHGPLTWLLYSPLAVVITLVNFLLPLAVLPIYAALRLIDERALTSAQDLGASGFRVLVDIVAPQTLTGIIGAFSLSFLIAVGDYVTPQLVGGPESVMVGSFIEDEFVDRMDAPLGAALATDVLGSCLLIVLVVSLLLRRFTRQPA
jgi:spermidine/putrescine transport system permease protein